MNVSDKTNYEGSSINVMFTFVSANTLDGLIEDVFEKTKAKQKAPCAYNGYRIGIALVTKIKATDRLTNTSLSTK